MSETDNAEYLVISRGQWDADASPEAIQAAIDVFYPWIERNVAAGRMRPGSRLKREGATVARKGTTFDGPFGESKEVIGGFWVIIAASLEEAARLAAENPCMRYGLYYEIRPLEGEQANAYRPMTETPDRPA